MQDRFVGDIGDYLKLSILRHLSPGYRLGIAWWLHPNESHNADGRHIGYLQRPDQWRHFDPGLFDKLGSIVASGQRNVRALEATGLLPRAIFASDLIPVEGPVCDRPRIRRRWFEVVQHALWEADLVFMDPDNGLEPDGFSHGSAKAGKSVTLSELRELSRPARCLIVYHHPTRRVGGHHAEVEHWTDRLRSAGFATVDALRARPYSPRVYFLLNAPARIRQRAEQIGSIWAGKITWRPDKQVADDPSPELNLGLPTHSHAYHIPPQV